MRLGALAIAMLATLAASADPAVEEVRDLLAKRFGGAAAVTDDLDRASATGHYTHDRPSMTTEDVGSTFTGDELYLYSDGSYIATHRACALPETIEDKGSWWIEGATVVFRSDADITWTPRVERRHVALRFQGELLLLGLPRAFHRLAETDERAERRLLIMTNGRTPLPADEAAHKAALMSKSWRPAFFGQ